MTPQANTNWQSATILVAFAVFIVWMERHGRWAIFAAAMAGDYQLANTRGTASGGTTNSNSPSVSTPNPNNPGSSDQSPPTPSSIANPYLYGGASGYAPPAPVPSPPASNTGNSSSPPAPNF